MGSKYTDAQKRATQKYKTKRVVTITVYAKPDERDMIKEHIANHSPKESMTQFILRAVRNQIENDKKK